jgi:hypothetical protein
MVTFALLAILLVLVFVLGFRSNYSNLTTYDSYNATILISDEKVVSFHSTQLRRKRRRSRIPLGAVF